MQVTQEMELILDKSEGDFPLFQSEWLEKWVTAIVVWAKKRGKRIFLLYMKVYNYRGPYKYYFC